jgi:hypothetical protein
MKDIDLFYSYVYDNNQRDAVALVKTGRVKANEQEYGDAPLFILAVAIYRLDVAQAFLDSDPQCMRITHKGRSVLHWCTTIQCLHILLPHVQDVSMRDSNGKTAAEYHLVNRPSMALAMLKVIPTMPLPRMDGVHSNDMVWSIYWRVAMNEWLATDLVRHFW